MLSVTFYLWIILVWYIQEMDNRNNKSSGNTVNAPGGFDLVFVRMDHPWGGLAKGRFFDSPPRVFFPTSNIDPL